MFQMMHFFTGWNHFSACFGVNPVPPFALPQVMKLAVFIGVRQPVKTCRAVAR